MASSEQTWIHPGSFDTLILPGDEVKMQPNGKFGGYLVLFGSPTKTDLVRDFFTPDTDYGFDFQTSDCKSRVFYDHGLDPTLKLNPLAIAELKMDTKGIWAEGVLEAREKYSKQIKEIIGKDLPSLIAGKKLGWSSGTAPHLVEKVKVGNAFEIKSWPLGIDASLTATPCEPRTLAVPLKSWEPSFAKGVHLGPRAEIGAAMSAVEHLHNRLHSATWEAMGDEKSAPKERMAKIGKAYDECKSTCMRCMKALLGGDEDEAMDAAKKALELDAELLAFEADLGRFKIS